MKIEEKASILVVEDIYDNMLYLENVLRPFNVNLIKAYSGKEALAKIEGKELALALIDIQMPEMDGIELATLIQSDKSRDIVPIIFITAYFQNEIQLEKCYNSGAVDFIQKPVKSNILKSKVKVFLELFNQKQQIFESEEKYHSIVEQTAQAVVVMQEFRIVFANSAFQKMSGYSYAELEQMKPDTVKSLFLPIENFTKWKDADTLESTEILLNQHDFRGESKTGRKNLLNVYADKIVFRGREAIQVVAVDITLQRQIEDELKNIFTLSTDLVFILDIQNWIFKKTNPAFQLILGYSESELINQQLFSIFFEDDIDALQNKFSETLGSGIDLVHYENRWKCRDGSFRWMTWSAQSDLEKGIVYGIATDVTERKLSEEAIRDRENMYRTLLNASPEGIIILDLDGIIVEPSLIALEIFSKKYKEDLIGRYFVELFPADEVEKIEIVLKRALEGDIVRNEELILRTENHSVVFGEISMTLILNPDGSPKSFMAILRDVTQRKMLEHQLNNSERMAVLGEMASGIAHEINQPLNILSLSLENILFEIRNKKEIEESYLKKKSERIFENVLRIKNIIDHVRAFSRDHNDYLKAMFSVNESVSNAISMVSEQFRHKGIELLTRLDETIPTVFGNTYKLEQVVLNTLINAKDAVDEKAKNNISGYSRKIEVFTSRENASILIRVCDNGIGMKQEILDKVMLPFFTTKETGKGTGLGLSLSFGIIKEMNGIIEIESEYNQGSVIKIFLPISQNK